MLYQIGQFYELPSEEVLSARTVEEINRYLRGEGLPALFNLENHDVWVTAKGKLPKRYGSFLHKNYNMNLTNTQKETIGNLAQGGVVRDELHMVFTLGCSGTPDDYANSSSCLWGGYSASRDWIAENGGGAVRFYTSPEIAQPRLRARAWWMPIGVDGGFFIFNTYGVTSYEAMADKIISVRPTSDGPDLKFYTMHDSNGDNLWRDNSTIYYNNGRPPLYIGPRPLFDQKKTKKFLVMWAKPVINKHANGDQEMCVHCGSYHRMRDMSTGPNDELYCRSCHRNLFFVCSDCRELRRREDGMNETMLGDMVCSSCFGDGDYIHCQNDGCFNVGHIDSMKTIHHHGHDDVHYCPSCAVVVATDCDDCGEWHHDDDITIYEYDSLCPSCLKERAYKPCHMCGKVIMADDLRQYEDDPHGHEGLLCPTCHEEAEAAGRVRARNAPDRYERMLL